ncbi:hypothetical protein PLICRDRAFT_686438 [Plicaturopsis crispa FD-325 SS-3]|nr:hypothetical protein PLICRDRAFT_686438 [Plicaturopsis crispa FD-325 SS-3]
MQGTFGSDPSASSAMGCGSAPSCTSGSGSDPSSSYAMGCGSAPSCTSGGIDQSYTSKSHDDAMEATCAMMEALEIQRQARRFYTSLHTPPPSQTRRTKDISTASSPPRVSPAARVRSTTSHYSSPARTPETSKAQQNNTVSVSRCPTQRQTAYNYGTQGHPQAHEGSGARAATTIPVQSMRENPRPRPRGPRPMAPLRVVNKDLTVPLLGAVGPPDKAPKETGPTPPTQPNNSSVSIRDRAPSRIFSGDFIPRELATATYTDRAGHIDALDKKFEFLEHRTSSAFTKGVKSIVMRIEWPGYTVYEKRLAVAHWNLKLSRKPLTIAELAGQIAKYVKVFMDETADVLQRQGPQSSFNIGPGAITIDDLALVSFHQVSTGIWQPLLRLKC